VLSNVNERFIPISRQMTTLADDSLSPVTENEQFLNENAGATAEIAFGND
jgi:hypothetical protein